MEAAEAETRSSPRFKEEEEEEVQHRLVTVTVYTVLYPLVLIFLDFLSGLFSGVDLLLLFFFYLFAEQMDISFLSERYCLYLHSLFSPLAR